MNAKWLEAFIIFRLSSRGTLAAKEILRLKIEGQFKILSRFTYISPEYRQSSLERLDQAHEYNQILLIEARFSFIYWNTLRKTQKGLVSFHRNPVTNDSLNQLLNIGYYFLRKHIEAKCKIFEMPVEMGLLHKAKRKKSLPLVYDLMEPLRPILVDYEWIKYIHLKKKVHNTLTKKEIAKFVSRLKKRLKKRFYHRELKRCISLDYWIYLYVSHFYHCVSRQKPFEYIMPTLRHETRCDLTKNNTHDI